MLASNKNLEYYEKEKIMELKVPTIVRWYRYWIKKGGFFYGQENLCHFIRTVLFYAPVRWFFFARCAKVVAPWSVSLLLALPTLFWLWPKETSIAIGVLTVVVGFSVLPAYFEDSITEAACNFWESAGPFLTFKVVGNLPTWFFLTAALIGLGLVFLPDFTFPTLFVLFAVIVWIAVVLGLFYGAAEVLEYRENRKVNLPYEEQKPGRVREFLKVIGAYLLAFKKGICPFVEVKENSIVFYLE